VTPLRLRRIFWIGAAAILVAAALIALEAVAQGDFSDTDGRILVTLAALLYTGGAALAGLALVDRRVATTVGWLVAAAAPVCLAFVAWGIWSFVDEGDGNETADKLAWSWVLVLLAGLMAATALLLARRHALVRFAALSGALSGAAAGLAVLGIWSEPDSDAFVKVLAALWILAALSYFLVPVLQRFTAAGERESPARIVAELDGVELVASRYAIEGVAVQPPASGERLFLRRRV
jgi:hypothetical protein